MPARENARVLQLRKTLLRMRLARPDAALIKASGGEPRTVNGKTLDPRFQMLEHIARADAFDWTTATPEQARGRSANGSATWGGRRPAGVRTERLHIPGRSHSVPGLLYLPFKRDNRAAILVYFHFGGGVIGSLKSCDRLCGLIARAASAPVLSVDYRLAPEHKFPAGFEDARVAYLWARDNAARYGAAVGKAAVGGDSQGGTFAAALAQEMRPKHTPALQLLIYPFLDPFSESASVRDFADAFPLTVEARDFFIRNYLPDGVNTNQPRIAPARTQDLKGLPRALIYTAGFDILYDQGENYAARLAAAGVPVERHCFEDLPHGFVAFTRAAPAAEAAIQRIASETGEALKRA